MPPRSRRTQQKTESRLSVAVKKQSQWLGKHKAEAVSLSLALSSLFVAGATFTFEKTDPSFFSTGTGEPVKNFAGIVGAYFADLIITIFGFAAYALTPLMIRPQHK